MRAGYTATIHKTNKLPLDTAIYSGTGSVDSGSPQQSLQATTRQYLTN